MTVNHRVVGSSPTRGAKKPEYALRTLVFFFMLNLNDALFNSLALPTERAMSVA